MTETFKTDLIKAIQDDAEVRQAIVALFMDASKRPSSDPQAFITETFLRAFEQNRHALRDILS